MKNVSKLYSLLNRLIHELAILAQISKNSTVDVNLVAFNIVINLILLLFIFVQIDCL